LQGSGGVVVCFECLEVAEVVQEMIETVGALALLLYTERPLEANPDEELEVVSKTGDQG
jgi:hypothetical protein